MRDFSEDLAELRSPRRATRASTCRSRKRAQRLAELEERGVGRRPLERSGVGRARSRPSSEARERRRRVGRRARAAASPISRRSSELAREEGDDSVESEIADGITAMQAELDQLELRSLFVGDHDERDAICEIHSGAGGTDAQDWAEMLLRMYTRWAQSRGFEVEVDEVQEGQEAGHHVGHVHREGPVRVRLARGGARCPPLDPHLAVRRERAPADRVRVARLRARDRAGRGARDRPRRPPHRHVPLVGRGRAARQRHRLGGAHHAPADGHRRVVPERAIAAPEPGQGDADPRRAPRRTAARGTAQGDSKR